MKSFLLYLSIAGMLVACRSDVINETNDIKTFDVKEIVSSPQKGKLSTIVSSVEYVPLETSDSVLVHPVIRRIRRSDNRIVILDKMTLWLFDKQGRFVSVLMRTGNGPREFVDGLVEFIHTNTKEITSVFVNRRMIQFDSLGRCIYESPFLQEKLDSLGHISQIFGSDKWLWLIYRTGEGIDLAVLDVEQLKSEQISAIKKYNVKTFDNKKKSPHKYWERFAYYPAINGDGLYFADNENGILGHVSPQGKCDTLCRLDLGTGGNRCWVVFLRDMGNYLFLRTSVFMHQNILSIIYDKKQKKFIALQEGGMINDVDNNGMPYDLSNIPVNEKCYYRTIPIEWIHIHPKLDEKSPLKALIPRVKEDDNQVLVFMNMKK